MTDDIGATAQPQKPQTSAELIAELNAELRGRDPYENLRRQIRTATLNEFEARARADGPASGHGSRGGRIARILADMRAGE